MLNKNFFNDLVVTTSGREGGGGGGGGGDSNLGSPHKGDESFEVMKFSPTRCFSMASLVVQTPKVEYMFKNVH